MKKEQRIKYLDDCLSKLEEMKALYKEAYPAWTLIRASQSFIETIHHLESKTNFNEEYLGVKE